MIASLTLTERKGHPNTNSKSNRKGTLTSELNSNLKMTDLKGVLQAIIERSIHIETENEVLHRNQNETLTPTCKKQPTNSNAKLFVIKIERGHPNPNWKGSLSLKY